MKAIQEKSRNAAGRASRPVLLLANKNKGANSRAEIGRDKLALQTHEYPTRLNAKKHKQPQQLPKQQELPPKVEPQEQTKCSEQTQESVAPSLPILNPQLLIYKQQILCYLTQQQQVATVDVAYLRLHKTYTPKMRSFLIRHFFKIYLKFNLRRTTLHLAVHLMDLYFWRKQQEEIADQLQTVALGQTCLFIAMKYEEIYPPQLASWLDLRHLRSIIKLEAEVLKVLEFQLGHYTLEHFLQMRLWEAGRQLQQLEAGSEMHLLVDLTLFDINIRQLKTRELALCIYELTSQRKAVQNSLKSMALNVRWMVERNSQPLAWLIQQKYGKVLVANLL